MNKGIWADSYSGFDNFLKDSLPTITDNYISQLEKAIEYEYPDAMIVYILRNYTKCRHLKTLIK